MASRLLARRWAIAAGAVLALVAGGCGGSTAYQSGSDGGSMDFGTSLGFADARLARSDTSGESADRVEQGDSSTPHVQADADLPADGSSDDASQPSVCGDGTCEVDEKDSCAEDCGASCGERRCQGEDLCHDGATCAVPTAGTTIIYATRQEHDGNLGGRIGANTICRDDLPPDLPCGQSVALLSVSPGDSVEDLQGRPLVADMPLYAYDRETRGLTLLADDWQQALSAYQRDATPLAATLLQGAGAGFGSWSGFWSGSQVDGSLQPDASCGSGCVINHTCNGWTTNVPMGSTNYYGTQGDARSTSRWLHASSNYAGCSNKMRLLCACRSQ